MKIFVLVAKNPNEAIGYLCVFPGKIFISLCVIREYYVNLNPFSDYNIWINSNC